MYFRSETSPAASLDSRDATPDQLPAKWQLVWCHNHSFRRNEDRAALNEAVRALSGVILCFKKASGFLAWLARQPRETASQKPYLLLTDIAGMKSLMTNPQQLPIQPKASLLLCEDAVTVRKANTWLWLQGVFASPDPVSVHQDVASVVQKLNEQFTAPTGGVCTAGPPPKTQWPLPSDEPVYLVPRQSFVKAFAVPPGVAGRPPLATPVPQVAAGLAITTNPTCCFVD